MHAFLDMLKTQRWDDHRYYHHSRINQTLHLISATTFLVAYGLMFFDPAIAALIGWLIAMTTRQSGHFFFEPKCYDHINEATHEHKEDIKVGYNLFRKWVLMGLWAATPLLPLVTPSFFGLFEPYHGFVEYVRDVGLLWFWLAVAGVLFRTIQLIFIEDWITGLAWATKILTDPFNDIRLYYRAPSRLLRGELVAPGVFGPPEDGAASR